MGKELVLARITQLGTRDGSHAIRLVHPAAALFDICEFNAAEGLTYQPIPAPHAHGATLEGSETLLLDHALLGHRSVNIWNGEAFEATSLAQLAGGHVVRACVPLPTEPQEAADREAINAAVSEFTDRRIQQRLDETLDIPPLPEAARKIIALQANPDFDLSELVAIVETDPAIAAKIMSWANSAFYAADPPARALDDAIMRILGFDLVMNLALGLVLSGTIALPDSHVRGAPPIWLQAVFTAAAMEAIGHRVASADGPSAGSCYLTGLLSNFGTLVLGHVFPPQYRTICRLQEANPHLATTVIDEHVLRLTREALGATLLEQWELPDEIVTAIRHQQTTAYMGAHTSWVALLQLARGMLSEDGFGAEEVQLAPLGLDAGDLEAVADLLKASQAELEGLARAVA